MGQQQLLLIILGVIVVGVAVAMAITIFADNAISANRDALSNDLLNLAVRAQEYYRRPQILGGGGRSFVGLTGDARGLAKLTNVSVNANGTYSIVAAGTASEVVIQGVGTENNFDGQKVTMQIHVRDGSRTDSLVQIH